MHVNELRKIGSNDPSMDEVTLSLTSYNAEETVGQFVSALKGNTNIHRICICVCKDGDSDWVVGPLLDPLLPVLECFAALTDLTWWSWGPLSTPHRFLKAVACNNAIKRFQLMSGKVSIEALSNLIQTTTSIKTFHLDHVQLELAQNEALSVEMLAGAFAKNSSISRLRLNSMERCYLIPILTHLSRSTLSPLQDLNVRFAYESLELCNAFRQLLESSCLLELKVLHLMDRRFSQETFSPISHGFERSANVSVMQLECCSFDSDSTLLFESVFRSSTGKLNTLHVGELIEFARPTGSVLANCLGHTSCLKELRIRNTTVSDAKLILQALETPNTLDILHIETIENIEVCTLLADELPKLCQLRRFRFGLKKDLLVDETVSTVLMRAFRRNTVLIEVTYTGSPPLFNAEQCAKLKEYAVRNDKLSTV